jgi:Dolichyl-phosphate-mannose-protein mannosyltransferase
VVPAHVAGVGGTEEPAARNCTSDHEQREGSERRGGRAAASADAWKPSHRLHRAIVEPRPGTLRTLPAVPLRPLGQRLSHIAATRRSAVLLVFAAATLPRLIVAAAARHSILQPFTYGEKSDDIARTFLASGTFGFIPGHPTAYTQPLYSYFLIAVYWVVDRSWEVVGGSQAIVAGLTATLVYELGRRYLSTTAALLAALVVAFHPYSLWHDVHVNREILDGLLAVAIMLGCLELLERRSFTTAAVLGAIFGLSILGNVRLTALPLLVAALCLVTWRPLRRGAALAGVLIAACVVVLAPWVIRNRIEVGCFAITTDSRALWEANNPATLDVLRKGSWIDNVPLPASFPPSAQDAGREYRRRGRIVNVDECGQVAFYEHKVIAFWRHHPGEKVRLAVQGSKMLWNPVVSPPPTRSDEESWLTGLRDSVEPIYIGAVFVLAVVGLFVVPRRLAAVALLLLLYQWAMAIVFVGATRYRVPWDFVPALLAAAAVAAAADRYPRRRTRAT